MLSNQLNAQASEIILKPIKTCQHPILSG